MPRKNISIEFSDKETKTKRVKGDTKTKAPKKVKISKKETLIRKLADSQSLPQKYQTIWTEEQLHSMCNFLSLNDLIAVDTETMGTNPFIHQIVGISFYVFDSGFYIPIKHFDDITTNSDKSLEFLDKHNQGMSLEIGVDYVRCLPKETIIKYLKPLLEDSTKKFILHNSKFDIHVLHNWLGIDMKCYYDTLTAQALFDENKSKALKDLATDYLQKPSDTFGKIFGNTTFDKAPILMNKTTREGNLSSYYAIKDTELTYNLYEYQLHGFSQPNRENLLDLIFNLEMPFLEIVIKAERRGVKLDSNYLNNTVGTKLNEDIETLRMKIWDIFKKQINLNSPAQVAECLFIDLKLPSLNPSKPLSTDKKILSKLIKHHPVIPLICEYKEKTKLKTAFVTKLPNATVKGRVHTSFNTTGTVTGRMSSSSPNLQQIPARVGGLIRNAFISDENRLLASIDFSQQELRVLAHVSDDPVLLDIYKTGRDVHSMTGLGMWNKKYNESVSYEDFEYRRGMFELFQDKDKNFIEEKFQDTSYTDKLLKEGKIRSTDIEELKKDAELGVKYEKSRKSAKTVNLFRLNSFYLMCG